ncbi:MAG: oligopeptide transporter, OPT family [Deltaproteobacteria bacterium]|nr:oligopeptide transporter, OPT family [Deltaproteobacteria bacterium]MBI3295288.1 oligopeptide transporter, OPT family [Deltaproteobacteria bacterium]
MSESESAIGHKPFVSAAENLKELAFAPVVMGVVLGIVFGGSSLYLALKVGMTVSASIPVAVLSITLFRALSKVFGLKRATILENNIVQTTGSAGESIAFGVAVTMPALLILGYDMEIGRIMLVSVLGGLLGVLMMIPLRNALIVKGHGELTYPEGTACAQVLIAGERGGTSAKTVFGGFFLGLFYKIANLGLKLFPDVTEKAMGFFKGASASMEISPELLGVGYIIGPRISCIMVAGGILSSWVLIPMITLFGEGLTHPLFPGTKLISQMATHEIWKSYVLYIGAGAVAAGGIISLVQSLPTIIHGAKAGLGGLKRSGVAVQQLLRTERDIPLIYVLLGTLALVLVVWSSPSLHLNLFGSVLIILFGFLFVTVSSRLTGEIGSSSNPISGMTVATLLITSVIFLALGWVSPGYRVTALSIAAIVCVAASNGGTTSQDLKTGFLLGATPVAQQVALLIGVLTSAVVIGYTLNVLNDASTVYSTKNFPTDIRIPNATLLTEMDAPKNLKQGLGSDTTQYHVFRLPQPPSDGPLSKLEPGKYLVDDSGAIHYFVDPGINGSLKTRDDGTPVQKYDAPKARLMSLIIDGILTQKLPWGLVLLGVAIALVLELCGISALPFAVGVYLPLSSSTPIFVGGVVRWLVEKINSRRGVDQTPEEAESGPGVLFSSGLIAGGSIAGIGLALLSMKGSWGEALDLSARFPGLASSNLFGTLLFLVMGFVLLKTGVLKKTARA